jgi:hypothetical protein
MRTAALMTALLLPSLPAAATLQWGASETAAVTLQTNGGSRAVDATLQELRSGREHGMLLLVPDTDHGLVWWYSVRSPEPITFAFFRRVELPALSFATNGERIAAFSVRMPNLAARGETVRAASSAKARQLLQPELEKRFSQQPASPFVLVPLAEQTGVDFLRPLHPHETHPPVSIDSVSFDGGIWNVVLKNERDERATLRFSTDLQPIGHARLVKE